MHLDGPDDEALSRAYRPGSKTLMLTVSGYYVTGARLKVSGKVSPHGERSGWYYSASMKNLLSCGQTSPVVAHLPFADHVHDFDAAENAENDARSGSH
jgi:hypothetical protein